MKGWRGHFSNKTHWRTEHVKAFIYKIGRDEGFTNSQVSSLKFEIYYGIPGGFGCLGKAVLGTSPKYHGLWMALSLPREGEIDMVRFAQTIAHEWGHIKGIPHNEMIGSIRFHYKPAPGQAQEEYDAKSREYYGWARNWKIEPMIVSLPDHVVQKVKQRAQRLAYAEAQAKRTATRIKRLQTALKRWERRIRSYKKTVPQMSLQ